MNSETLLHLYVLKRLDNKKREHASELSSTERKDRHWKWLSRSWFGAHNPKSANPLSLNGKRPPRVIDVTRGPGLLQPLDRNREDEVWNRYIKLTTKLVIYIIREAVPFYILTRDNPWLWEYSQNREKDIDQSIAVQFHYKISNREVQELYGTYKKLLHNSTYLRLMYGHYDWLLEPFDKSGEDLLDTVHQFGDRKRWPGVNEPSLPGLQSIQNTSSELRFLRENL